MKTAVKIFISIIIIGVILALVGLIIIDFDFGNLVNADEEYTLNEDSAEETINDLVIDVDDRIIKLIRTGDEELSFSYYEADNDIVTVKEQNEVLTIEAEKQPKKWRWFHVQTTSSKVRTITVFLPQTFSGEINVTTANGSIYVEELGTLKSLDLTSKNGSIEVKKVSINEDTYLRTSNGTIIVEDVSCYAELNMRTNNGKVEANYVIASKIDGESSDGNVNLHNAESNNIIGKTSNGSVDIIVKGEYEDYEIEVSTSLGQIRVNGTKVSSQTINSGKDKKIRATTFNGSVEVDFK